GIPVDADLSDDGRYVFYVTSQSYVAGDTNGVADVYRFDTATSERTLVSVADDESPLSLGGDGITLSGDGNLVVFHSASIGNFAPGVRAAAARDIAAGTTRVIGAGDARVSADGRYAALLSATSLSVTDLQTNIVESLDASAWGMPFAPGQKFFDFSPTQFFVVDRVGHLAFRAGPDEGALAYVGDGALVSSTSFVAQAYVWRGPFSSVSAFSPDTVEQGTSSQVTLTGSNLIAGTVVDFGAGVSVSNFEFVGLQQAKVTLSVAAGATPGARQVGVTATTGCATSGGGFQIAVATPPTTTTTTLPPTTTTTVPTTTSTTVPTTTTSPTTTLPQRIVRYGSPAPTSCRERRSPSMASALSRQHSSTRTTSLPSSRCPPPWMACTLPASPIPTDSATMHRLRSSCGGARASSTRCSRTARSTRDGHSPSPINARFNWRTCRRPGCVPSPRI
ncbi:MAG: hypothetical protein E6G39_00235, partial [Actinobacteria bacterium]